MNIEIERKFLVDGDFKSEAIRSYKITQGYLTSDSTKTIRIRIRDEKGFITIKGKANKSGVTRYEWEKEISLSDAKELLLLCDKNKIEKRRYIVEYENHIFEVDEFFGENSGLIIAEIELKNENEFFKKPKWLGKEVTGDLRYYNSKLKDNPYKNWK